MELDVRKTLLAELGFPDTAVADLAKLEQDAIERKVKDAAEESIPVAFLRERSRLTDHGVADETSSL